MGTGMPFRMSRTVASWSAALTTFAGIASSQVCESTLVSQSSRFSALLTFPWVT